MDDPTPTDVPEADPVDPMDDPFAVCEMIADCVDLLDQRGPVGEPLRRVELWQAAAAAHDALGVVVHQIAADAVDALASRKPRPVSVRCISNPATHGRNGRATVCSATCPRR
jgi:hypothetical protein